MPKFKEGSIIINKQGERHKILGALGDVRFVDVHGFDSVGVWKASAMEQQGYVEEAPRWEPSKDEKYWYVENDGEVTQSYWSNDVIDKNRHALGNCFRTREETEAARERVRAALKG